MSAKPIALLALLRTRRSRPRVAQSFTSENGARFARVAPLAVDHGRRRIVNFNITSHPTAGWIIQQLREAFPYQSAPRFLIFDRDAKYGLEVPIAVRSMAIRPVRTSFQSPWQNGIAERWVESCPAGLVRSRYCLQ
jgi:hypothetical protein